MFEVEIGGKKVKADVSFYTAQLYEVEFRSDLIKDLFGTQDLKPNVEMDGETVLKIDFTSINWLATAKVLWAAIKTADESTPSYTSWMKATKGLNMWLVSELLSAEVADCFFRAEAPGADAEKKA